MGLEQLSDNILIQRGLQDRPLPGGNDACTVLWQRHAAFVDILLRSMLHAVPQGYDPQVFHAEARQQVYENLRRRLSGYRGPDRFKAYLTRVVYSAALDELRVVKRRLAREQAAGDARDAEARQTPTSGGSALEEWPDEQPFRSRHVSAFTRLPGANGR